MCYAVNEFWMSIPNTVHAIPTLVFCTQTAFVQVTRFEISQILKKIREKLEDFIQM